MSCLNIIPETDSNDLNTSDLTIPSLNIIPESYSNDLNMSDSTKSSLNIILECDSNDLNTLDFTKSSLNIIPEHNIDDNLIMDDALSVNKMLDINLNFKDLKTEENSLLPACEELISYTVNGEINADLDMPNIMSSSSIDIPFGFDNAGTLLF
jgi:hypothetical protein